MRLLALYKKWRFKRVKMKDMPLGTLFKDGDKGVYFRTDHSDQRNWYNCFCIGVNGKTGVTLRRFYAENDGMELLTMEYYNALPSWKLVLVIKDCKKLLACGIGPTGSIKLTIKTIRDILIERQVI